MTKKELHLTVVFYFVFICFLFPSEPIKIAVISDVHYLATSLAKKGDALAAYQNATGRNVEHLHEVLDSALLQIEQKKVDILFISGDITNHGEKASHLEFIQKLTKLQQSGIRVFVVPGNHDINVPDAKAYIGEKAVATATISAEEFATLYAPFGYGEAIKRDSASLSYLVPVTDSLWLLAIDTNRYAEHTASSISGGRILPETLSWCRDMLRRAKEKNISVVAMMHHGLVEHIPYQATFFPDYVVENWQKNARILADEGLQVVFTGHFHANDITRFTSDKQNVLCDIETGSLAHYPFPYRIVTVQGKKMNIQSYVIEQISQVPALQAVYEKKLEEKARKVVRSKLRTIPLPIPDETSRTLIDILARIAVMHAAGDEKPDDELREKIQQFAFLLQQDEESVDFNQFQLDLPPQDNQLDIILK